MVRLAFINPLDQPTGRRRLLAELKYGLEERNFSDLRVIVAFAKEGPLLRLKSLIDERRAKGLRIEAIFGIDQLGTSAEALAFALDSFDAVYIMRERNLTFHPKMYLFRGSSAARAFVGSNNLTVGGTETNFEATVRIDFDLPDDAAALQPFLDCWDEMLPGTCPATRVLDRALLAELIREGTVPNEGAMRGSAGSANGRGAAIPIAPRSGLRIRPPSALPAGRQTRTRAAGAAGHDVGAPRQAAEPRPTGAHGVQGLALQIRPHHNGEIFLSVRAALQNPAFFKWPFTGATVPKKGSNTAYPQLTPDPIVNVTVYGQNLSPLLTLTGYGLNTVYYETKSEIRVTASPLVGVVPENSIMIIQRGETAGIDYEITIHTPASPDYNSWLAACNQQMPGGGKTPRKFGWF